MVLSTVLLVQSRKRKKHEGNASMLCTILVILGVVASICAPVLAYVANKRRGQSCALAMALVAFTFPDIYLLQAGFRALLQDYKLPSATNPPDTTVPSKMAELFEQNPGFLAKDYGITSPSYPTAAAAVPVAAVAAKTLGTGK